MASPNPVRFPAEYFRTVATGTSSTGTENFHTFGFQATQVYIWNDSTSTGADPAGRLYLTLGSNSTSAASTGVGVPWLKPAEKLGPLTLDIGGFSALTTSTAMNYRVYAWGGDIL